MTKIQKRAIQSRIDSARMAIGKLWSMTAEHTPEEAIVESMLSCCYALRKLINKAITED